MVDLDPQGYIYIYNTKAIGCDFATKKMCFFNPRDH